MTKRLAQDVSLSRVYREEGRQWKAATIRIRSTSLLTADECIASTRSYKSR